MSKKRKSVSLPKKIYPKTNVSRAYYRHIVNSIEHDPLIRHTTLTVACLISAICILIGSLIWYAQFNPGNLVFTSAKVTGISSGKIDTQGNTSTFVTFSFQTRGHDPKQYSVRQVANTAIKYSENQNIRIGYHPKNPNYARDLSNTSLPFISIVLWSVPFLIMVWFIFVALIRYIKRQVLIWEAAEAANIDE